MASTTWTALDLARLERAMSTGAQTVAYSDGKRVTYRSLEEMARVRELIKSCLASPAPAGPLRKVAAHSSGVRPGRVGPYDFTR